MRRVEMAAVSEQTRAEHPSGSPEPREERVRPTTDQSRKTAAVGPNPRRLGFFGRHQQERALKLFHTLTIAGLLAASAVPAAAIDISGAGATFPYPIYAKWADAYKKETG